MAPDAASHEVRKTVTVVFADVAGSTVLGERLDPEGRVGKGAERLEPAREVFGAPWWRALQLSRGPSEAPASRFSRT